MTKRLAHQLAAGDVTLVNATTAAFPPITAGLVPDGWRGGLMPAMTGVIGAFDLDFTCDAASGAVTAVKLYGAKRVITVVADKTFTATHGTETFTAAAHGLVTGDGPFRVTNSGGALPAGLTAGVDYWIYRVDANSFRLAASFALALLGTVVAISDNGTGTHTLSDVDGSTKVMYWRLHGDVTPSMSLAAREGLSVTCENDPRVEAYAVVWTGTASNAIKATISPREDK